MKIGRVGKGGVSQQNNAESCDRLQLGQDAAAQERESRENFTQPLPTLFLLPGGRNGSRGANGAEPETGTRSGREGGREQQQRGTPARGKGEQRGAEVEAASAGWGLRPTGYLGGQVLLLAVRRGQLRGARRGSWKLRGPQDHQQAARLTARLGECRRRGSRGWPVGSRAPAASRDVVAGRCRPALRRKRSPSSRCYSALGPRLL